MLLLNAWRPIMNSRTYKKNIETIRRRWPEYIKGLEYTEDNNKIKCKVSKIEGKMTPIVYTNNREYRLDFLYDSDKAIESWAKYINFNVYEFVLTMFGFGNGIYVRHVLKRVKSKDKTHIVVYEPNIFILKECIRYYDISDILKDTRFNLIIPDYTELTINDYMCAYINAHNVNGFHSGTYMNYPHIYEEEKKEYDKEIKRVLEKILTNFVTINAGGKFYFENSMKNIRLFREGYSLNSLKNALDVSIPAIIVSSGPSLQKNIQDLKMAKNRCFILAVDSALGVLDSAGIKPDMYVTIDPEKHEDNFAFDWIKGVPVVGDITSPKQAFKDGQMIFFSYVFDTYIYDFVRKIMPEEQQWDLTAGGSVANSAYKLLEVLGFKTIIFVGQDLAYTNDQSHARDVAYNDDDMTSDVVKTIDIYGNTIKAHRNYMLYKRWFEDKITANPDYTVIDATEGGAYIKGSIVMSLKDAIEKYSYKETDIEKMLGECKPLFNLEQKRLYDIYIDNVPKRLKRIVEKADKLIERYNEIELLIKNGKKQSGELKKFIKNTRKYVKAIEDDPVYCYVEFMNISSIINVEKEVNRIVENEDEDLLKTCNLGRNHAKAIIETANNIIDLITPISGE